MADQARAGEGWFVVDHDRDDRKLRGPFEHAETAGAVRSEMERQNPHSEANLWVVSEPAFSGVAASDESSTSGPERSTP